MMIEPRQPLGNPGIRDTNKSSLPIVSWKSNCSTRFKIHFGNDSSFTKKISYTFTIKNPADNVGDFSKSLTSGQWSAIKRLVKNVSGSPIYWYVESWDGLGRYSKTDLMSFVLTD